jgi:hypothetical protein
MIEGIERHDRTWVKVHEWVDDRLLKARHKLETETDPVEAAELRGEIRIMKRMISPPTGPHSLL